MSTETTDKYQILLKGGEFQEPYDTLVNWMMFLTDPAILQSGLPDLTVTRFEHRGLYGFYKLSVSFDKAKASIRTLHIELPHSANVCHKIDPNSPKTDAMRQRNEQNETEWVIRIFNQTALEHLSVEFPDAELPDLFDQLPNLKTVSFFRARFVALPPSFYRLSMLESLDISSSSMPDVPADLGQVPTLRSLTFSQPCAPKLLASLPRLTHLICKSNKYNIPAEITLLADLQYLHVRNMTSAPDNFLNFTKLEYLHLHTAENPAALNFAQVNIQSLKELDTNCISAFVSSVGSFRHLERLVLRGKPLPTPVLEMLTSSISQLHALKYLTLSGLGIANIDFCLSLPHLRSLDVSSNAIENVSEGLGKLHDLTFLDLSKNAIVEIPADLRKLNESGALHLKDNPIHFLPELNFRNKAKQEIIQKGGEHEMVNETGETMVEWLTFLTDPRNLKPGLPDITITLDSRQFDYSSITVSFGKDKASLRSLKLDLVHYSVGEVSIFQGIDTYSAIITSAENENPHQLRKWIFNLFLNTELEDIQIPFVNTELPDLFGALTKLKRFDASDSRLTKLPPSFCLLSSLEILLLNKTPLLELPEAFGELSNLVHINLSRTRITEVPPSFVQLQNVETLLLDETNVTDLSHRFNALCNLKTLSLNGSRVRQLPQGLLELPGLEEVLVERTGLEGSCGRLVQLSKRCD